LRSAIAFAGGIAHHEPSRVRTQLPQALDPCVAEPTSERAARCEDAGLAVAITVATVTSLSMYAIYSAT